MAYISALRWGPLLLAGMALVACTEPGDDDDAADDDTADDDIADDDIADDDDADDDATDDDDDTSEAPAVEELGGYLSVLYTHLMLTGMDQEMADAGGRFHTYLSGSDEGSFAHMEMDSCAYHGPDDPSTFGDLQFVGRTAGDVKLVLGGDDVPLSPSTGEDGQPIYQNGGLTVGGTFQFDGSYGIEATGADVPAFSIDEAIHVPPNAQPMTPALSDGWYWTGGDWPITWSGTTDGELRLTLMLLEGFDSHEVLCRLQDDGAFSIPADMLGNLPNSGIVSSGTIERIHTRYHELPDGTVLEAYGSNTYLFYWNVTR